MLFEHEDLKIKEYKKAFEPPKLPIRWIASVFIAPALIVLLPYLLTAGSTSLSTLIIIGLTLLSVLLLVLCFSFVLRLYDEAFSRQILEFKVSNLEDDAAAMHKRLDILVNKANKPEE